MKILQARAMGWCFGVRDAVALAESVSTPSDVTIYGELVHNEQVLVQLEQRGLRHLGEADRRELPSTPAVLITAHGVSDQTRRRFDAARLAVIDTTCPLVRRVHVAARQLVEEHRHLLLIGQPGHVEVLGIVEDFPSASVWSDSTAVIATGKARLGVIAQSTTRPDVAAAVLDRIRELHPTSDIRWVDTICQPTRDRQAAVDELLSLVTVLIVVGGQRSNNSRALAERAAARGVRAHLVQAAEQVASAWFSASDVVGLTAGTSTPDDAIASVARRLEEIRRQWD